MCVYVCGWVGGWVCVWVCVCMGVQFKEVVSAPFCESIHLAEVRVNVAMGKQ